MQFVVTTHSPIILQGASDIAQIVVLDGDTIKPVMLTLLIMMSVKFF